MKKIRLLFMLLLCAVASGVWATDVTYKLTITDTDFTTKSYADNNGNHSKDAVCTTDNTKTMSVSYYTYQIFRNSGMQWQNSKGYIYNKTNLGTVNSVTVTSSAGSFTTVYGTSENPSSGTQGTGKGYFKTSVGNATGTSSKVEIVFTVTETDDSKENTDVTITPSITNTDVYVSKTAGSLSATVKKSTDESVIEGAEVTWSSSDDEIATIESTTGVVTLVSAGDVTFTATYSGDDDYNGSSATYDMTVTSSAPAQPYFLVNDADQLAEGDKIIIVAGDYALGTKQNANNRDAVDISDLYTTDYISIPNGNTTVQVITLEGSTGAWHLKTGTDAYLYAASSSSNYLRTDTKTSAGDNAKATITFSGDNAIITFQGSNTNNKLQKNSSSALFSCYSTNQTSIQIYKATTTVTLSSACTDNTQYYGTFSCPYAFVVPEDVTVSEITVAEGLMQLSAYDAGAIVPANTGVVLTSATAGEHTFTLASGGSSVLGEANMLRPSGVSASEMGAAEAETCKYYRLTMHNGELLGFWWGAADGAAFDYAAMGKAYLAVPTAALTDAKVSGFVFGGETTGIGELKDSRIEEWKSAPMYNLAGQRVNGSYKGLVIVNGKKYVRK